MVALLLLYPTLSAVRLVGTDLVQAVPLVLSAAISHVLVSGVEWAVLIPLIVGGTPGTFLGARLANWVSQSVIRRGIVIVLTLTGLNMLGVPPEIVGIIGAGAAAAGPPRLGLHPRRPAACRPSTTTPPPGATRTSRSTPSPTGTAPDRGRVRVAAPEAPVTSLPGVFTRSTPGVHLQGTAWGP